MRVQFGPIHMSHGKLLFGIAAEWATTLGGPRPGLVRIEQGEFLTWTSEACSMTRSCSGRWSSAGFRAHGGRDHNPFVFTNWHCGGGIKGGVTSGESEHWGYKPLERDHPSTVQDVHATVMKLLGIEQTKLIWRNNGIDRRFPDVHGHIIGGILA
jgi:hypothetical protein